MRIINHQTLHIGTKGVPVILIDGTDTGRYHVYAKVYTATGYKQITLCRFRSSTWIKALDRGRDVVRNFSLFKELFWAMAKKELAS